MKHLMIWGAGLAFLASSSSVFASSIITNGDFSAGLADWQTVTTDTGTISTPQVTTFDFGTGAVSALQIEVGGSGKKTKGEQGGGIEQTFSVAVDGQYDFSALVAAVDSAGSPGNADGGNFQLIVDGTVLSAWGAGELGLSGEPFSKSSTLSAVVELSAGSHSLEIQAERGYSVGLGTTPYQYIGDISAASPVPLPATAWLMLSGLGGLGVMARKRKSA